MKLSTIHQIQQACLKDFKSFIQHKKTDHPSLVNEQIQEIQRILTQIQNTVTQYSNNDIEWEIKCLEACIAQINLFEFLQTPN